MSGHRPWREIRRKNARVFVVTPRGLCLEKHVQVAARPSWWRRALEWLCLSVLVGGCATHSMVCTLVRVDGEPALGCVDARTLPPGTTVGPYGPVPPPSLPERQNFIEPYWRYEGYDEKWQEKT